MFPTWETIGFLDWELLSFFLSFFFFVFLVFFEGHTHGQIEVPRLGVKSEL